MVTGSEVTISETHSAQDSFSRILLGRRNVDWSADVNALKGQFPVIFMNGMRDPQVSFATLQNFQRDYDRIDYRISDDSGPLIFFCHWSDVLDTLGSFVKMIDCFTPSRV